jgi:hypothetical protein
VLLTIDQWYLGVKLHHEKSRTGVPQAKGVTRWSAYSNDTDRYLYIAEKLEEQSGFSLVAQ